MKIYNIKHTRILPFWEVLLRAICVIAFLPVFIILASPLIRLRKYCRAKDYVPTKMSEDYADKALLIAHRGFRAVAPENTLPAYYAAGEAHYWGAENDIHRTADGVWVLHHDNHTFRMLNKDIKIESSTFEELQRLHIDNGSNYKDYPDLKVPTLEEYLKICADYNMVCVIEIKGKNNIEHYHEIVELVAKYGVEAQYIAFSFEAVQAMRKLTDAKLFYLVYDITEEKVNQAKTVENCGISFDGNDKRNQSAEAVGMITGAGLEGALWAVDDVKLVENYVDWGIKYITTNQIHY